MAHLLFNMLALFWLLERNDPKACKLDEHVSSSRGIASEVDEGTVEVRLKLRNPSCERFFERCHPLKDLRDNRKLYRHLHGDYRSRPSEEVSDLRLPYLTDMLAIFHPAFLDCNLSTKLIYGTAIDNAELSIERTVITSRTLHFDLVIDHILKAITGWCAPVKMFLKSR